MQSCYSSPQQLQAAAAAALSFHQQHQHRLASFPLMNSAMSRLDRRDQRHDVGDDVTDEITPTRLTAERRVLLLLLVLLLITDGMLTSIDSTVLREILSPSTGC